MRTWVRSYRRHSEVTQRFAKWLGLTKLSHLGGLSAIPETNVHAERTGQFATHETRFLAPESHSAEAALHLELLLSTRFISGASGNFSGVYFGN